MTPERLAEIAGYHERDRQERTMSRSPLAGYEADRHRAELLVHVDALRTVTMGAHRLAPALRRSALRRACDA